MHVVLFALIEFHVDAAMETGDLAFDGSYSILDGADAVTKLGDVSARISSKLSTTTSASFSIVSIFFFSGFGSDKANGRWPMPLRRSGWERLCVAVDRG